MIRLNLGSGSEKLRGYLSCDIWKGREISPDCICDMSTLPFKSCSVDEIRCSHALEHISTVDLSRTLSEWHRVLKWGGMLWVIVPDFRRTAQAVLDAKESDEVEVQYRHLFGSHMAIGEEHKNGFTIQRLADWLYTHGFVPEEDCVCAKGDRGRQAIIFDYPGSCVLHDIWMVAYKEKPISPIVEASEYTYFSFRRAYPKGLS